MRNAIARMRDIRNHDDERGAAIVAAIGVMIICISLGVLIVSQAISTQRDSGRNRARTAEMHTAEAGVDILHSKMQKGEFPCSWTMTFPDIEDPEEFTLGPDEVGAEAEIKYWDEDGNSIGCLDSESFLGDEDVPARAQILVTSANERDTQVGIEPKRSFESEVILSASKKAGVGAAIFSGAEYKPTNISSVKPVPPNELADVWVASGNVDCNSNHTLNGNLYILQGGMNISGDCHIDGSVWAREFFKINASNVPVTVDGDVIVYEGGAMFDAGVISGNLTIRDSVTGSKEKDDVVMGNVSFKPDLFPSYEATRLPEVNWKPADWQADGFRIMDPQNYYDLLRDNANDNNAPDSVPFARADESACSTQITKHDYSINGPLVLPSVPTVIDARKCDFKTRELRVELYADTAIFADSFKLDGNTEIVSGDNVAHNLWLIVPDKVDDGKAVCDDARRTIETAATVRNTAESPTFMYSPCEINPSNNGTFYGQMYGNPVIMHNQIELNHVPMAIPGVDLIAGMSDFAEWRVEVVYKRETSERVEVN